MQLSLYKKMKRFYGFVLRGEFYSLPLFYGIHFPDLALLVKIDFHNLISEIPVLKSFQDHIEDISI